MMAQEPTRHSSPDYDDSGFSLSQLASFDAPPPPPLAASPPSARLATPLPSTPPPISGVHLEDLAFPLDDDWENDLHSSPLKPRPSSPSPEDEKPLLELNPPPTAPPLGWAPRSWCRCTVKEVREDQVDEHGWYAKEVLVETFRTRIPILVVLEGEYAHLPILQDDVINLISPSIPISFNPHLSSDPTQPGASSSTTLRITLSIAHPQNFLILHPDLLVPNTTIASSLMCPRKALIKQLVRSTTSPTTPLIYGNILHETLQALLQTLPFPTRSTFSPKNIKQVLGKILQDESVRNDIFKLGVGMEDVRYDVEKKAMEAFGVEDGGLAEKWCGVGEHGEIDPVATLSESTSLLSLSGIHDSEEDIRSPMWGLQGKIDVSVQATLVDNGPKSWASSTSKSKTERGEGKKGESWTMPFEIKTGRSQGIMEHRAQTMLYTLLMEDRYATPIPAGLLYYSQSNSIIQVPAAKHELRSLLNARNVLASFLFRKRPPSFESESAPPLPSRSLPPSAPLPRPPPISASLLGEEQQSRRVEMEGVKGTAEQEAEAYEDKEKEREEQLEREMWGEMDREADLMAGDVKMSQTGQESFGGVESRVAEFLPATIDVERECKKCYQVDACMLYRKAVEQVVDYDSPIAQLYEAKTAHLSASHLAFFQKWEELVTFEEQDVTRFASELWTMSAEEREKKGRCFAGMKIDSYTLESGPSVTKTHRHTYRLSRSPHYIPPSSSTQIYASTQAKRDAHLLIGHLSAGDVISISIEPDLLSLARGFITDLTPYHVTLGLDHKLDVGVLQSRLGVQQNRARKAVGVGKGKIGLTEGEHSEQMFRIDKDELTSGLGRIRDNLAQLFLSENADERRRDLVVDLSPPVFDAEFAPTPEEISPGLNEDQRRAMEKVLTARDYALILGMPGTGKTTTIVEIILTLVKRGKSVLLTSYTHSAVDTIMVKLLNLELRLLRLGNPDKIHPDVKHLTLGAMGPAANMEQMEHRLMSPQVVATTALTIDHPVFTRRRFDYCIVDEASQITLPTCLGPLRFAETFILVGDHFQLPPLVKSPSARRGGLDISLFRRLHEAHPEASVDLSHQYRMNEDIMTLSNELIYHGKLKCGNQDVRVKTLTLPKLDEAMKVIHAELGGEGGKCVGADGDACWLEKVVDPSRKALFLNTDNVSCPESRIGDLVQNIGEAHLVRQITETLLLSGLPAREIGIITLYRQQIKLLQHVFKDPKFEGLEILTADKSQGRDKSCILISMVRSNESGSIGDLLRDWRRINVALTRAKHKLLVLGSRSTLTSEALLAKFVFLMEANAWALTLPVKAGEAHEGGGVLGEIKEVKEEVEEMRVELGCWKGLVGGASQAQAQTQTQRKQSSASASSLSQRVVLGEQGNRTEPGSPRKGGGGVRKRKSLGGGSGGDGGEEKTIKVGKRKSLGSSGLPLARDVLNELGEM